MELDFDKLFKNSMTALKIIGWDPRVKRDKFWFLHIIFMFGYIVAYFFNVLYNIIYYDLKNNNFTQATKNGTHVIVYITAFVNTYVVVFHQKPLIKLIKNVMKEYEISKSLTTVEQLIVKKYAYQGTYVCKQWLLIALLGTGSMFLKNIFLYVYNYWMNEFELIPFYDVYFPKIIDNKKNTLLGYLVIYIYLFMVSTYMSLMTAGYIPLGPILMLHASGQLEIVKRRINNLFVELDDDVIQEKLKIITEHLQHIYSFVDITGDTFKIGYEWGLMASTLILPVSIYAIFETAKRGEFTVEFIVFVFGGLLYSSSPCYYSDLLMEKGEEVRMALYTCGWERHYSRRARTLLQILLLYALRPVAIKSVFKTLCLDTLTDVYQQSYTIFNLMNAMWE